MSKRNRNEFTLQYRYINYFKEKLKDQFCDIINFYKDSSEFKSDIHQLYLSNKSFPKHHYYGIGEKNNDFVNIKITWELNKYIMYRIECSIYICNDMFKKNLSFKENNYKSIKKIYFKLALGFMEYVLCNYNNINKVKEFIIHIIPLKIPEYETDYNIEDWSCSNKIKLTTFYGPGFDIETRMNYENLFIKEKDDFLFLNVYKYTPYLLFINKNWYKYEEEYKNKKIDIKNVYSILNIFDILYLEFPEYYGKQSFKKIYKREIKN